TTWPLLLPPVMDFLLTRFHSGMFMSAFAFSVMIRRWRGDWGPDGKRKGLIDALTAQRCITILTEWQNRDGSWIDSVVFTSLLLPALLAAGLERDDVRIRKGGDWLLSRRTRDLDGLRFDAFGMEVWVTGFQLRALLASGVPHTDPDVQRGLEWLVRAQSEIPVPRANNRKRGGLLTGGWALESTNHTMADCDDTGVVLSALGMAQRAAGSDAQTAVIWSVRDAIRRGGDWVLDMQNPDGGWSAYVWNLPGKEPGPTLEKTPRVKLDDLLSLAGLVWHPPASLSDPSTEDVTARVLHGLGQCGLTVHEPSIARAVEFLRVQQCESGAWWGRWAVNYVNCTAFVLLGLRSVGADLRAEWVRRGLHWLISVQNPDGGWGEGPESYRDPKLAARAPSMPALTGLVVAALIDVGEGDSAAVTRGVQYLLDEQRADGSWLNRQYLHTNIPPDTFYVLPAAARFYPQEALGKYLAWKNTPVPPPAVRWSDALLDRMRQQMDPEADFVVRAVYDRGSVAEVNAMLSQMFRSDAPIPEGLPVEVRTYLEREATLPAWADRQQIALAEGLFTRAGWQIAAALFCSSLPQAYAAAHGAHVIAQTQGMTRNVRQRVFETAQFLFDTMDEGALHRGGRGLLATQKVRLMHAGIRHLLFARPTPAWDSARLGFPVNQEDLVGTLLTFSLVTLDALERLGVDVSRAQAEAWLHAWKVVGALLGVCEELLPVDVADARALMDAIRARQWAPSDDGRLLAAALVHMMQDYFPGRALDGLPVALVRYLAGDHCADLLGLPRTDWTLLLVEAAYGLDKILDQVDVDSHLDTLLGYATHTLMKGIVTVEREGKQARFRIPLSLRDSLDGD
ncbi:MAG: hypothetical protein RL701_1560, partial [Pseudomonadota bacterium]